MILKGRMREHNAVFATLGGNEMVRACSDAAAGRYERGNPVDFRRVRETGKSELN